MVANVEKNLSMTEGIELEKINPKESSDFPGFYYFPDDNRIVVSREGEIINVKTGNKLKAIFGKSNRTSIIITSPGKKPKAYQISRVLARTFIGRPVHLIKIKFKKLEVNHIDGNTFNNAVSNLEWVTSSENVLHSYRLLFNREKVSPVLAKNLITREERRFKTLKHCAEAFNIHRATLWKHLIKGNSGRCKKNEFIFKFDDGTPWVETHPLLIKELGIPGKRNCLVIDFLDNIVLLGSEEEIRLFLNMSKREFKRRFKGKDQSSFKDYILFFN